MKKYLITALSVVSFSLASGPLEKLSIEARGEQSSSEDFKTLQGEWAGDPYLIVLHNVWQDVKGSWGDYRNYSLVWDPYYSTLKGRSAGIAQKMAIDDLWGEIQGESLCGDHDFTYSKSSPWVLEGLLCHEMVKHEFESQEAMKEWIKTKILRDMVADFPEPTRNEVFEFLFALVKFERD